jgi:hypothetical protein
MREETISQLVKNISAEMVKAGEAREPFQLRDLRRTAETMLAKLGTGPNIRVEVPDSGSRCRYSKRGRRIDAWFGALAIK